MSFLDQIYSDIKVRGLFTVGYGNTGAGKTTTLSQAPGTVLIQCLDNSSDTLKNAGFIPKNLPVFTAKSYEDTIGLLHELAGSVEKHKFANVTIDGSSGIDQWVDALTVEKYFADAPGKFSAWGGKEGEAKAAVEFLPFVEAIESLLSVGLNVNLLAHATRINHKNTQGEDYMRMVPQIGNATIGNRLASVLKIADLVLFFDQSIAVEKGKASFAQRVIRTGVNPSYEAKNRCGLPDTIECEDSARKTAKKLYDLIKAGSKKESN